MTANPNAPFTEYIAHIGTIAWRTPDLRNGQRAFNVLHAMRPDLSEQIRATDLDPFHDDDRLEAFYAWVERNW